MNYISEINNFYDWLETNPVSDSAIVLWHALMHINNRCGWKPEFDVAISTIQNKTGMSKSSVERARTKLAEAGRIKFSSRPGRQSARYSLLALQYDAQTVVQKEESVNSSSTPDIVVLQYDAQSESQTVAQSVAQTELVRHTDAQTVAITKLNILTKKGEGFFYIGTEIIKSLPSDRINSDHSFATDRFMMTIFRGLDKATILQRLDDEYLGYQFRDEMHLRNSFKTVAEKIKSESKPKPVWGAKPEVSEVPASTGYVFGQKSQKGVANGN